MLHTIAIKLKIPDNTAYSALTALRRLGVEIARVERADIWQFDSAISSQDLVTSVERNESLFNPNKHILEVLSESKPRAGETWIAHRDADSHREGYGTKHFIGWRLFEDADQPASRTMLQDAIEKLLCNPAIERAIL